VAELASLREHGDIRITLIRAFFADPDYVELMALRKRTSTSIVVAMDGVA
jgi:hypothetical protein